MFCAKCGSVLAEDAGKCDKCGAPVRIRFKKAAAETRGGGKKLYEPAGADMSSQEEAGSGLQEEAFMDPVFFNKAGDDVDVDAIIKIARGEKPDKKGQNKDDRPTDALSDSGLDLETYLDGLPLMEKARRSFCASHHRREKAADERRMRKQLERASKHFKAEKAGAERAGVSLLREEKARAEKAEAERRAAEASRREEERVREKALAEKAEAERRAAEASRREEERAREKARAEKAEAERRAAEAFRREEERAREKARAEKAEAERRAAEASRREEERTRAATAYRKDRREDQRAESTRFREREQSEIIRLQNRKRAEEARLQEEQVREERPLDQGQADRRTFTRPDGRDQKNPTSQERGIEEMRRRRRHRASRPDRIDIYLDKYGLTKEMAVRIATLFLIAVLSVIYVLGRGGRSSASDLSYAGDGRTGSEVTEEQGADGTLTEPSQDVNQTDVPTGGGDF